MTFAGCYDGERLLGPRDAERHDSGHGAEEVAGAWPGLVGGVVAGLLAERSAPLSNAERQRRHRQRKRELAAAPGTAAAATSAESRPARGYSWEPFQPGHTLSVKSGIYSKRFLTPRADEILLRERAKPTWPAYLEEPVYERAVRAWSRSEAMLELYTEYVAAAALAVAAGGASPSPCNRC